MKSFPLSSSRWLLRYLDPDTRKMQEIPAQVPGNVIGDLFRAGRIPDPYYAHNTSLLRPYEYIDWEYATEFTLPELPTADETIELCFEGIDTQAEVFLNGVSLGQADNMLIEHCFMVPRDLLMDAGNVLLVKIASSVNAARKFEVTPGEQALPYNFEGLHLRRAMHTYGWDICPRLVGAGLWRPVEVRYLSCRRWTKAYLHTDALRADGAHLMLDWSFTLPREDRFEGYSARLTMVCGTQRFTHEAPLRFCHGTQHFVLPAPQLWWPAGAGAQNLYDCTLELLKDGRTVDTKNWQTGIRTIRLDRTDAFDAGGNGRFRFVINGEPIFIRGSNWVPSEAMHGENPERVVKDLELWTDLGCNMLRCWGGGIYEDDAFFEECDRRGILVWQDFMLACEAPPQDEAFLEAMRREATTVVRRIRHHACLALWSGDNECDCLRYWGGLDRFPPSVNRVTREVLPQVLVREDPSRDYLPSSPYICDAVWAAGGTLDDVPEQHLWGPRDYWKSEYYTRHKAVFASEMGYHGMPEMASLREFLPPEALKVTLDDVDWNCHAAQPFEDMHGAYSYRIGLMHTQIRSAFGKVPEKLEDFVAASQFVQAEAMKFFLESFRLGKPRTSGLIWWNVIDCWPQISDAVVDYYYRRKPAYYYLKTSQQLVLLACREP
ncbi:MAG: hypothetical protein IKS83_05120, partial [Victivallales bacterium]|nr:hypothetical protein [Victivallales bacterium]